MNNDLISREALKKALQNREECKECTDIDCIHCFYDIINNAPAVHTEECKGCPYCPNSNSGIPIGVE